MEGNPEIKKEDFKHEVYFDSCNFILDDQTMKLYDANEYYKALYHNELDQLKEVAEIKVKREDFFELMKNVYD